MARDGAVLPKAVYRLTIHEFDGPDQASAGAAVVLVTARVAEVDVGADEALLVAQQDHDLQPSKVEATVGTGLGRLRGDKLILKGIRVARTCCGGSCPQCLLSSGPQVRCWVRWC